MIAARLRREETGLTLVELSVAMMLLGVVMAFSLQSVASFQRAATGGIRRLENLDEARLLMQVMTKDIRTAAKMSPTSAPFIKADDNEAIFYANLNLNPTSACPKIVRIYVDASQQLIESIYEPTSGAPPNCTYSTYPATPTRNRFVGRYIANAVGQPIFKYYYDPGSGVLSAFCWSATQPAGCTVDATPAGTGLSAANRLLVKTVGIEIAIRKGTSLVVDETTMTNNVRLPNVYYNPVPVSPSP